MMPLIGVALVLLSSGFGRQQSGTISTDDIEKLQKESGFSCERGLVMGMDGTNPVANTAIMVHKAKRTFPYRGLTVMQYDIGKIVARLRTDRDGYVDLAPLKPGDYFFDLTVSEGKASSLFLGFAGSTDKKCTVELRVTRVEDALVLSTRRL
jgi:hypothetical protein